MAVAEAMAHMGAWALVVAVAALVVAGLGDSGLGVAAALAAALAAVGASADEVAVAGATDGYNQPQCRSQCSLCPRTSTVSTTPHRRSSKAGKALEAGRTTDRALYNLCTRSSRMCIRCTKTRN